jgi:hypothetical protein
MVSQGKFFANDEERIALEKWLFNEWIKCCEKLKYGRSHVEEEDAAGAGEFEEEGSEIDDREADVEEEESEDDDDDEEEEEEEEEEGEGENELIPIPQDIYQVACKAQRYIIIHQLCFFYLTSSFYYI